MINTYRIRAEINLGAIYRNIQKTKELIHKNTKIMAIVKADGYGHGAVEVAEVLHSLVDSYGVAMIEEAVELREADINKPILLLGYTPEECYPEVVKYNIIQTVYEYKMAAAIAKEAEKQNKIIKIHLKVDTGMGRIGFPDTEESIIQIQKISKLKNCKIEGCFTHFSKADEKDLSFAKEQLNRFLIFIEKLEESGIEISVRHASNSAGIIRMPEANLDMVRSGISTYGLYPSDQAKKSCLTLEPAMAVRARISYVKTVESQTPISYGGTFITNRKSKIATVPVGYADGYPRALSSKGRVLIHGKFAPIIGKICMDQFMIDVTEIEDVKQGDTVTLLGMDGDLVITAQELGELAYSFHYEIICGISKRVPRVYY